MFVSLVPHTRIKHKSREEPTFCDTQKEASGEESGEIVGETHEGANGAPYESQSRKPEPWGRESENDVGWDLEKDVTDKVDGQRSKVLVSGLFQLAVRSCYPETLWKDVLMCVSAAKPSIRAFPTRRR